MRTTLTCIYCGAAYPDGTPTHGAKALTDHIKVCEKHPMREAEQKITILRKALMDFVGANTPEGWDAMELMLRGCGAPDKDMVLCINAINALRRSA